MKGHTKIAETKMQLARKTKIIYSNNSKQQNKLRVESQHNNSKQRHRVIANARERDRTESVNYAFTVLRGLLPTDPPHRKLSKIEILRLATSYIQHLDNVRTAM